MRPGLPLLGFACVVFSAAVVPGAGTPAAAAPAAPAEGVTLTVYRTGGSAGGAGVPATPPGSFALVSDRRRVQLAAGESELRFEGVSNQLDAGSVRLRVLAGPEGVEILEQHYRWDLAGADAVLARYVGETITLVTEKGERRGRLRAFDAQQIVLETEDPGAPVEVVLRGPGLRDIRFGALPGGKTLATRPTLSWKLRAKTAGEALVEVTYQTTGLSWSADYAVVLGKDAKLGLSGWVSVENKTEASFADATLRLAAGDVARAGAGEPRQPVIDPYTGHPVQPPLATPPPLRLYDVPGRVTLPAGQTRQLELVAPARELPGRVVFVHEHVPNYAYLYRQQGFPTFDQQVDGQPVKKVEQLGDVLELDVARAAGGGLPAGRLRVYKDDAATRATTLVADEPVGHTEGRLRVRLGSTRDVTGERRQVEFRFDDRAREMREKFEIRLKNSRKEAVEVVILESMFRWRNWAIDAESSPHVKSGDGLKAEFRVKIPAGGETVLTYTVRYHTW